MSFLAQAGELVEITATLMQAFELVPEADLTGGSDTGSRSRQEHNLGNDNRVKGIFPDAEETVANVGLAGEERDLVCGIRLNPRQALEYVYRGHRYHFCSESCREQFRATPEFFLRSTVHRS